MKINILYPIQDGPWGGGNQFLKTIRKYFVGKGVYEHDPLKADIILVNSKDCLAQASALKTKHNKVCVHRIDGIFRIYRGEHEYATDLKVYDFSKRCADGVIYQSEWSMRKSKKNGMPDVNLEAVIFNCANDLFFNSKGRNKETDKIRLITSSWSNNIKKGFKIYKFIDENLNFDKYEYVLVGRSPFEFKNIVMKGCMNSEDLSKEIKKSDIFITATEDDTCSNSLIEALTCGLPAIGLNSGGTPEIIKEGGIIFNGEEDILSSIENLSSNLNSYSENIRVNSVEEIGSQYLNFIEDVFKNKGGK